MHSPIANWRHKKEEYRYLDKIGKIISFTKIYNLPEGFGKLPYYTALVGFRNGKKMPGQLVLEGKEPQIESKVRGVIRRIGVPNRKDIINYGIKFKLI